MQECAENDECRQTALAQKELVWTPFPCGGPALLHLHWTSREVAAQLADVPLCSCRHRAESGYRACVPCSLQADVVPGDSNFLKYSVLSLHRPSPQQLQPLREQRPVASDSMQEHSFPQESHRCMQAFASICICLCTYVHNCLDIHMYSHHPYFLMALLLEKHISPS